MSNVAEDLFEYDQPSGRLQVILHRTRWRWILAGIMALTFGIPFLLAQAFPAGEVDSPNSAPLLLLRNTEALQFSRVGTVSGAGLNSVTEYKVNGGSFTGGGSTSLKNFTDHEGLASMNKSVLTSVSLSNVYLDAAQFSKSVEGCINLESISLENVWLTGNFTRVHLPKLTKFFYTQNADDKRDSYKSSETLKSTLFFDKNPDSTWNVETDLLNLGVDICLSKAGTQLIDIRRNDGEIFLNVKYCQDVLLHVKGPFDRLTLVNCNVTAEALPVIPSTLKYLNLRNSIPPTASLSQLLKKQTLLEEFYGWLTFHCEWPGYELFVEISDFPPTTKKLGLNNVDWSFSPGAGTSSIKEITVGDFMTETMISAGLPHAFQDLNRINIVNVSEPSSASSYHLISQAMKMRVKEIAVINLMRNFSGIETQEEITHVEGIIDTSGIPKAPMSCILFQWNNLITTYSARELTVMERHEIRYKGLGFDKIDLLDDYLKWDSLQ